MNRFRACAAVAVGVVAGLATTTQAATLNTAPAVAFYWNDSVVYCQIRNIGSKPVDVTIEGVDGFAGSVVSSLSTTLTPGQGKSHLAAGVESCRFTVNGSARNVRAAAIYFDGTDYVAALPAR